MQKTLYLDTPKNFNFKNTLYSHGWSKLLPFTLDEQNLKFCYIFSDKNNIVSGSVSENQGKIEVTLENQTIDEEKILRDVRHILRFDDDLSEFYKLVGAEKTLEWIPKICAGRLLRSPTVFEDLVKTICTTNCSWSMTEKMVTNLVEKLGAPTANGKRAFPTAEAMASVSADFYRDEIRAGYRSGYFVELAERVASGKLNPEDWLDSGLPTKELKKQMKNVKGVGNYAAENLLKLVGNYEGLALDSWVRAGFYAKHNNKEICEDKQIEQFYERFGKWRGLAAWCDMTEKWFA
jgi:3-methyladenine DNA glycosylase/8-oxoguanine DNA glycosylase